MFREGNVFKETTMPVQTATRIIIRKMPVVLMAVLLLALVTALCNGALAAEPTMPEDRGRIDRIDYNNEVVIDDVLFYLTPHTKYYSALGKDIPGSEFVKGTSVAYSLMPGRLIILTLWKTE
jgi:hypothetical protein